MPKTKGGQDRLSLFQYVLISGDFLLLAILVVNGWQLYQAYIEARDALSHSLLSDNPDEFAAQVLANSVPTWVWIVEIASLVITAAFIVAWLAPKLRARLPLTLINSLWLVIWLGYFVFLAAMIIVLVNSWTSFT